MIIRGLLALAIPISAGALAGWLLRRPLGGRIVGSLGPAGCLLLPPALAVVATIGYPVVGLWDALTEGLLAGVGLACRAAAIG